MTVSIKPIKCYIENKYLYDMDETKSGYSGCEIIAISAYIDSVITFTILIEQKYIFSYIPIFALKKTLNNNNPLSNEIISYINCIDNNIDVFVLDKLIETESIVYFKNQNIWLKSNYLCTIDFYKDNVLLHLVSLENGQFCLTPSHKINFKNEKIFPDYKKLHKNWQI